MSDSVARQRLVSDALGVARQRSRALEGPIVRLPDPASDSDLRSRHGAVPPHLLRPREATTEGAAEWSRIVRSRRRVEQMV